MVSMQRKPYTPEVVQPDTAEPDPEIISESFFFLTSSSFSSDLSNGLMPTDYENKNKENLYRGKISYGIEEMIT